MATELVDATKLDACCTAEANAIRAKTGSSAQIAYDWANSKGFADAITAIPTGGGTNATFLLEDFILPSNRFALPDAVPNTLADGGCIHYVITLPYNPSTSSDCQLISFGVGAMDVWSPSNTPVGFVIAYKNNTGAVSLRLKGLSGVDETLDLVLLADSNRKLDIKFYADHYIDCNTQTSYTYTTAEQTWFTTLASKSYLSVTCNQSSPLAGAVITHFAMEET